MKKINFVFLMTVVLLWTSCSSSQSGLSVGNVSNSECLQTRAGKPHPKMKLTRNGMNIDVSLANFEINCAINDVKVDCQQYEKRLEMMVEEDFGDGSIIFLCKCPINVYYTLYDIEGDEFLLVFNGQEKGIISFKEHRTVIIDLYTLEQAYDGASDDDEYTPGNTVEPDPVQEQYATWAVGERKWVIDADQPGVIESDLSKRQEIPEGTFYGLRADWSSVLNIDSDGKSVLAKASGIDIKSGQQYLEVLPEAKDDIKFSHQPLSYMHMSFTLYGQERSYDAVAVKTGESMFGATVNWWLCENLTSYYQAMYPDAGVRKVVFLQELTYHGVADIEE